MWVSSLYAIVLFAILVHCDFFSSLLKAQILLPKPRNTLRDSGTLIISRRRVEDGKAKSDMLILLIHDLADCISLSDSSC